MIQIAVIGNKGPISKKLDKLAEEVGTEIAKVGAVLISGGKDGVMEASCRGAKSQNGLTVGIFPFSSDEANKFVDIKIPTLIGFARNSIVANSADAIIAVGGDVGTLIEILYGVQYSKPIVLLNVPKTASGEVENLQKRGMLSAAKFFSAKTAKEAVELAVEEAVA